MDFRVGPGWAIALAHGKGFKTAPSLLQVITQKDVTHIGALELLEKATSQRQLNYSPKIQGSLGKLHMQFQI